MALSEKIRLNSHKRDIFFGLYQRVTKSIIIKYSLYLVDKFARISNGFHFTIISFFRKLKMAIFLIKRHSLLHKTCTTN